MATSPGDAGPGTLLTEQLELIEEIGTGAMGSVWCAEDRELGRRVAIKLIKSLDARAVARFRREASLAAKIKSPHVVEIYRHGVSTEGEPYIEMELLEGESLASRIALRPMPMEVVEQVLTQVTRALSAAHRLGVVHRDIKPGNIFLVNAPGYEVFVKVVDFGIAKQRSDTLDELTATGAVVGTPYYMSPEHLTSTKDVDHRADLWAVAVVVYQMLTGRVPFRGETLGAVSVAVSKGIFEPLTKEIANSSDALNAWFERAFRFDMDDRYQSADELSATFASASRTVNEPPAESSRSNDALDGDATAQFIAKEGFALDSGAARPNRAARTSDRESVPTHGENRSPASNDAPGGNVAERGGSAPPTVAREPTTFVPEEGRTKKASSLWMPIAVGAAALVGLGILASEKLGPSAATPSAAPSSPPAPSVAASAADVPASALAAGDTADAPSTPSPARGRLPSGYIQEVLRGHMDAFRSCVNLEGLPKRAMVRTLRFVIQENGLPRDVHVAELDPRTQPFDTCLVNKVRAMGFAHPEGGVVSISYPLVFSNDDWEPLDDAACRMTPNCRNEGTCSAKDTNCQVLTDADCALSRRCLRRGECSAIDGKCVARAAEFGPGTPACRSFGHCNTGNDRQATDDASCRAADACSAFGACTASGGRCIATSDDDCKKSHVCRSQGACANDEGWCVAKDDADCKRSTICGVRGACSVRFNECAAKTNDDCRASESCVDDGRCVAQGGVCVAARAEDCKRSRSCKESGSCLLVGSDCRTP